jgi:DNA-binding transcriptional ArsR family regulator
VVPFHQTTGIVTERHQQRYRRQYMHKSNAAILEEKVRDVAAVLRIFANEQRLLMVCKLVECGEASVGALADAVGLSGSAMSQHLAKMRGRAWLPSGAMVRHFGIVSLIAEWRNCFRCSTPLSAWKTLTKTKRALPKQSKCLDSPFSAKRADQS